MCVQSVFQAIQFCIHIHTFSPAKIQARVCWQNTEKILKQDSEKARNLWFRTHYDHYAVKITKAKELKLAPKIKCLI